MPGRYTIDFDDGSVGQYELAFPILERHGLKACFNVITGNLGTEGYMSWAQVEDLFAHGHQIGGHGVRHLTPHTAADAKRASIELIDHGVFSGRYCWPAGYDRVYDVQSWLAPYTHCRGWTGYNANGTTQPVGHDGWPGWLMLNSGYDGCHDTGLTPAYAHDNDVWVIAVYHGICTDELYDSYDPDSRDNAIDINYFASESMFEAMCARIASAGVGTVPLTPTGEYTAHRTFLAGLTMFDFFEAACATEAESVSASSEPMGAVSDTVLASLREFLSLSGLRVHSAATVAAAERGDVFPGLTLPKGAMEEALMFFYPDAPIVLPSGVVSTMSSFLAENGAAPHAYRIPVREGFIAFAEPAPDIENIRVVLRP
jgi:hypothetical protein